MNNIKNVFIDFNGTVLDDVDLCLELLNKLLKSQNKASVDINTYRNIFGFPIVDYYKAAGLDFNIESFDSMAVKFIDEYQPRSFKQNINPGIKEFISYLKENNINVILFSASKYENLMEQLRMLKIDDLFDDVIGISNIHARSKLEVFIEYLDKNNIDKDKSILIGDTIHDFECASYAHIKPILVTTGHQSRKRLEDCGCLVIDNILELKDGGII